MRKKAINNRIISYCIMTASCCTLIVGTLIFSLCGKPNFNTFVENTKVYDFPLLPEQIEGERLNISLYNKIFTDFELGEEYFYALNDGHYDDLVAGEIPEFSEMNFINEKGEEDYKISENLLFVLGRLSILENYESFLFKYENDGYEYILLSNYSKKGGLLSAICLSFKEKDGLCYVYSELKPNKEIWQYVLAQESIEDETDLRVFILDPDGHFRVIKEEEFD